MEIHDPGLLPVISAVYKEFSLIDISQSRR